MAAGILAGSLTSTPALVGAQDALRSGLLNLPHGTDMQPVLDNMGIGYALTYLVGLVGLMLVVRCLPQWRSSNLNTEAQKIARERGLSDSERPQDLSPHHSRLSRRPGTRRLDRRSHPARNRHLPPHRLLRGADPPQRHSGEPRTATPSSRRGTRSPWSAIRRATRSSTSTTATARRCLTATCSTCRSSPKR